MIAGVCGGAGGPQFGGRQRTAERARAGAAAALRCRVLRLADRAVSWIRSSDLQILTHAGTVFTADSRVSAITGEAADDRTDDGPDDEGDDSWDDGWDDESDDVPDDQQADSDVIVEKGVETVHTLRIERLRPSDSGRYECQINTEPKMSLFFNLTVEDSAAAAAEVEVRALGGRVVRGVAGRAAALACEARYVPPAPPAPTALPPNLPPLRIHWRHAGHTVDTQSGEGGVSLESERWAGGARSRLTLGALARRHAGRWRCVVGAHSATLTLQVLPAADSDMEAMQRDQAVARVSSDAISLPLQSHPLLPLLLGMLLALHLCAPT
ncbi:unnamed protein product [Parnassius mnemosyne]|uniref:Ig-like domain-containing protein n=1 Tax=Parnassius mnemosyne TaxID=213953 RepID=A0AAV1KDU7_9NEOP